ncbi:hypothetical protein LSH36_146g02014 [Paralvinella palmiformis]|uniref:E3 SUMO-protein ligase NSE2 n=1 Tax=Paralvinella palmiformis TaxID=53620 RepID=A0AAD9JW52_9ANNE|nr:hypothetical protein LSH36_146g02014 [Paralvinella palmiformis]
MDNTNKKRPADSGQTVDTFAVCSKCNRLSYNLKQCDKCGNPLSEDNAAMCVSAEPKRARLESPASSTNVGLVNGNNTSQRTSTDSETLSHNPAFPVPQALYKNLNASTPDSNITPQALYMNVNFCSDSSSAQTSNTETVSSVNCSQNSSLLHQVFNTSASGLDQSSIIPSNSSGSRGGTTMSSTSPLMGPVSQAATNLHLNSQMAPPHHSQSGPPPLVSSTAATNQANAKQFNNFNLSAPPPYMGNNHAPAGHLQTNTGLENDDCVGELLISNSDTNIALPAIQIRIGTRKFLPASSVTFKEDGILFALKDFTHAPVLLNARAIIKCEANMDTFPIFIVYLEATCIRQIRNIFSLTTDEFMENSPAGVKKCITIFPNVTPAVQKELRGRIALGIRKIFQTMGVRYPRSTSYLQEISSMQVIDLLFDTMRNTRNSDVIPRGISPSRPQASAPVPVASSMPPHHLSSSQNSISYHGHGMSSVSGRVQPPVPSVYSDPASRLPTNSMIRLQIPARGEALATSTTAIRMAPQRQINPRQAGRGAHTVRPTVTTVTSQSQPAPKSSSASTAGTTAPLLVVPTDQTKWATMQKDLVEGGVYHVELPTKERKYFLWDGVRLVPCLVQNTEVQLNCVYLRIGSLRAEAKDVKVRADNPAAFMFTVKSDSTGVVPVQLGFDMIASCILYNDGSDKTIMFLNPAQNGWWKLQNLLKLGGDNDPCYNPNSPEARRKHIIMIFKGVNVDQKDALLGIKVKGSNSKIFSMGHHSMIMKVLSDVYNNIPQTYYHNSGNKFQPNTPLDVILKEFMEVDHAGIPIEDDDDDVIMTSEEIGIKCPYTQQVMKEPVQNKLCLHNYEKSAIQEFIVRKKGNARCPYAGCGNSKPLSMLDLVDNKELKEYIQKHANDKT